MGNDSFAVQQELFDNQADDESDGEAAVEVHETSPEVKELERYNEAVSEQLIGKDANTSVVRRNEVAPRGSRLSLLAVLVIILSTLIPYMKDSREIGYCETGTSSNSVLLEKAAIQEEKARCTQLYEELRKSNSSSFPDCKPLSPITWPAPRTCTPCPKHASCSVDSVECNESFALKQHPMDLVLGKLLDGFPYFGPKAFPPSCAVDAAGLRKIQAFGKRLIDHLSKLHGQKICAEQISEPDTPIGKAKAYGGEITEVREALQQEYIDIYRRKHVRSRATMVSLSYLSIIRVNIRTLRTLMNSLETLIMPSNVSLTLTWSSMRLMMTGKILLLATNGTAHYPLEPPT